MRRGALLFGLLTCAVPQALAQGGRVTWNRLDVVARLDNDGRLEVTETHEMKVQGDAAAISRPFNYAADQGVTVHGVYQLESDGSRKALTAPHRPREAHLLARPSLSPRGQARDSIAIAIFSRAAMRRRAPTLPGGWIYGFSVDGDEGEDEETGE